MECRAQYRDRRTRVGTEIEQLPSDYFVMSSSIDRQRSSLDSRRRNGELDSSEHLGYRVRGRSRVLYDYRYR